jgi:RimJ/RimL family protein N-acetyltransferase
MQKTRVGTEAVYLLLKHTVEDLQFNRAEWRCNKLKQSALRFRLTFE